MPYQTQSMDTSREIEEFLFDRYRKMGPAEKLRRVGQLGSMVKDVAVAELRARFPNADCRELELRYALRHLGRDTMLSAFGWSPSDGPNP